MTHTEDEAICDILKVFRAVRRIGVQLSEWVTASEGFIEADVIRWTEGIYAKRRSKKAKSQRLGERQVTAEVLDMTGDGWLKLLVRACVLTKDDYAGTTIPQLTIGETIKRARRTVERGKPDRLLWHDESARDAVLTDSKPVTNTSDDS